MRESLSLAHQVSELTCGRNPTNSHLRSVSYVRTDWFLGGPGGLRYVSSGIVIRYFT